MLLFNARRLGRGSFSCDQLIREVLISLLVIFSTSFNRRMCGSAESCTVIVVVGLSPFLVMMPVGLIVVGCRAGASATNFQITVVHAWPMDGRVFGNIGSAYSQ